mgnify:FL=1|jgi:hypothetical protein
MNEATIEQEQIVESDGVEKPKEKKTKSKPASLAPKAPIDPSITVEQVQAQLNYAQKIISVLQGKVNEANGQLVQFEARLMLAEEDKQNILKQIEPMGISPQ